MHESIFIKYKPELTINEVQKLVNDAKKAKHKGIQFKIVQTIHCSDKSISKTLKTGSLLEGIIYDDLIANTNGIWNCVLLKSETTSLLVYTSGHRALLYVSI